ncbi:N-acetyltransferase 9 [Entomophthora muscae]|uniref:N-acetyltransferase 9 n=2 Tax=Entomophthora muscae TaxID=34485 RepID=A0ACC2SH81_9FUNG|nr:N-acetyltransferase 9 [Entomophthora muscae]
MLINSNTILLGKKVILIPYKPEHVEKYHSWMQSEELLEKTASERLSIEQEYEMQKSWAEDSDKLTFILFCCDKSTNHAEEFIQSPRSSVILQGDIIGDVNIFLNDSENPSHAELEIMIAEPGFRGRGIGKEALLIMMNYAIEKIGIEKFVCKVSKDNTESLSLFKDKLGFCVASYSTAFEEYTLEASKESFENDSLLSKFLESSKKITKCGLFDQFKFAI